MTEANRTLIKRYFDCLDRHDLESVAALLATEWRTHTLTCKSLGIDDWLPELEAFFAGFPDARFLVADMVAEDDLVATRHSIRGTHLAAFRGIPPTEHRVQVEAIAILRVRDGRICEQWLSVDFSGLLQQLGARSRCTRNG